MYEAVLQEGEVLFQYILCPLSLLIILDKSVAFPLLDVKLEALTNCSSIVFSPLTETTRVFFE